MLENASGENPSKLVPGAFQKKQQKKGRIYFSYSSPLSSTINYGLMMCE
jgi:hypothetical protein